MRHGKGASSAAALLRSLQRNFLTLQHILDGLIHCRPAIDAFADRLLDQSQQRLASIGDEGVEIIRAQQRRIDQM